RQHRVLQRGGGPGRRAGAGEAPRAERPREGQPRRVRGLVLPGGRRGGGRGLHAGGRDPRRRGLRRPPYGRDRGDRRRARAGPRGAARPGGAERGLPPPLRVLRLTAVTPGRVVPSVKATDGTTLASWIGRHILRRMTSSQPARRRRPPVME